MQGELVTNSQLIIKKNHHVILTIKPRITGSMDRPVWGALDYSGDLLIL